MSAGDELDGFGLGEDDDGSFAGAPLVQFAEFRPGGTRTDAAPSSQQPRGLYASRPSAEGEPRLDERYRVAQVERQQESDLDWLMRFTGGYPQPQPDAAPVPPATERGVMSRAADVAAEAPRWGVNLGSQIPGGVVSSIGMMAAAPDVVAASGEQGRHAFRLWQLVAMDNIDRGIDVAIPDTGNALADNQRRHIIASYRRATPEARAEYRRQLVATIAQGPPQPVQERSLYQLGQAIQEFGRRLIPLQEGYTDESVSTQLGRGIGSVLSGMVLPGGTAGRAAGFTSMGMSEATQNAVEFDRKEKAAGREGLTQEQIVLAGLLGVGPGSTDVLPIEMMLSRMGHGMPPQVSRSLAKAVAVVGGQVLLQIAVEGGQEGFQRFLQNAIAREVYNPEQNLFEGIVPEAAIGGGVGGMVETARQIVTGGLHVGRRGGGNASQPGTQESQGGGAPSFDEALRGLLGGAPTEAQPENEAQRLERVRRGLPRGEAEVEEWLDWVRHNGWTPYDILVARKHDPRGASAGAIGSITGGSRKGTRR